MSERRNRPVVPPRIDIATGIRVCRTCEATLEHRTLGVRFCSYTCRSRFHAQAQRFRAKVARRERMATA